MAVVKDNTLGVDAVLFDQGSQALGGAFGLELLSIGGQTFVYVAGYNDDGISINKLDAKGNLSFISSTIDVGATKLDGAANFATASFGSTRYLYAAGALENGINTFKVANDGSLTFVGSVVDDATLELANNEGEMTVVQKGGKQFLIAPGRTDDGVSVFELKSNGSLSNVANVPDTAATALNGAYATTSLTTATDTFVFVGGRDDHGITAFEMGADGSLAATDTVFNTVGLEIASVFALATATVGGNNYLIASGEGSDGLSVFSVSDAGLLLNVFNISHSTDIPLNGARGLKVFSFGGETYLAAAATGFGGTISYFRIEANGSLTHIDSVSDDADSRLTGASHIDFVELDGTAYLLATGVFGDGVNLLSIGGGDSTLDGTSGVDTLYGYSGNDTLNGLSGNDRLDGGLGADTMAGGKGDDVYVVDQQGDVIVETVGNGAADRVTARASYALAADDDIELLTTTNSTAKSSINLTGNLGAQTIYGNAGNNVLSSGGAGGATDVMRGLGGNDTYRVYNSGDTIVESATQGTLDRLAAAVDYVLGANVHVELMGTNGTAGTASIDLTGNALKQEIIGNAGSNTLHDGGPGAADTMNGLGGNDTYRVHNSGDVIFEAAGNGIDRVATTVSYALTAGAEVETIQTSSTLGLGAINLTGNEFAQSIIGNAGNNRLEGKGGADTLRGLGGLDTFVFASSLGAGNIDTIVGFVAADDRFQLSKAIFSAFTQTGTISSGQFRANASGEAQDANDLIIQDIDNGRLYYDADGSGLGLRIHFATVGAGVALTSADFIIA
ncbi:calcium-binding protein [Mesorhizobium sp. LHD-90]|uniref:beta strand repeat-containing protein n=1 Tax=Mesorhizobium sp. LHD-90 TaxID=3071414 RepID=UPI0027E1D6AD|nr:calcium-binding protein [Mesorhizobium sp. LHD-90]MDQ6433416.1 calcium-binding protein [Mesorhizobium sp. LHD-90]